MIDEVRRRLLRGGGSLLLMPGAASAQASKAAIAVGAITLNMDQLTRLLKADFSLFNISSDLNDSFGVLTGNLDEMEPSAIGHGIFSILSGSDEDMEIAGGIKIGDILSDTHMTILGPSADNEAMRSGEVAEDILKENIARYTKIKQNAAELGLSDDASLFDIMERTKKANDDSIVNAFQKLGQKDKEALKTCLKLSRRELKERPDLLEKVKASVQAQDSTVDVESLLSEERETLEVGDFIIQPIAKKLLDVRQSFTVTPSPSKDAAYPTESRLRRFLGVSEKELDYSRKSDCIIITPRSKVVELKLQRISQKLETGFQMMA